MWSKKEQLILWLLAYLPLIGIFIMKFLLENKLMPRSLDSIWDRLPHTSNSITELIYAVLIISICTFLGMKIIKVGLNKVKNSLSITSEVFIKRYNKPKAEHYSFFIVTMLLPLFSLDVKSITNLTGGLLILIIIILIYVKTDSISTNPLFFISGRNVFEGEIQNISGTGLNKKVFLISEEADLDLNNKFKLQHLAGDVYYIISSNP
ncbi:hypothetical protein [Neobacillus niacini]|uniref:hypothetical protein n=1 Tax=Neobacillus niacini TaxID=86668 RepID=UPI0005EF57A3|nr:hypothetical protein [Neobacillus niacini]